MIFAFEAIRADGGAIRLNEGVISSTSGAFQLAATSRIEGIGTLNTASGISFAVG